MKENPWLLDPAYTGLDHEKRLDTILKTKFNVTTNADEKNRRIDFFCLGDSGTAHVIEIKRPLTKVTREDIQQLTGYVDFLRDEQRKETAATPRTFYGWLIGHTIEDNARGEIERAKADLIYTKKWDSLLNTARLQHKSFFDVMKKRIPENDPRLENFN